MTRVQGRLRLHPDEKLTPLEAIRLSTMDNAFAVPEDSVKEIEVDMAVIDGGVVSGRRLYVLSPFTRIC